MNARVLRKWSLTKFLMYLWLPVIMLLVIWSQSATSMHLSTNIRGIYSPTPSQLLLPPPSPSPSPPSTMQTTERSYRSHLDNIMQNDDQHYSTTIVDHHYNQQQQQQQKQQHYNNQKFIKTTTKATTTTTTHKMRPAYTYAPVISSYNNINYNNNQQQQQQQDDQHLDPLEVFIKIDTASNDAAVDTAAANVPHVPKLNSQVINLNNYNNYNRLTSSSSANIDMLKSSSGNSGSSSSSSTSSSSSSISSNSDSNSRSNSDSHIYNNKFRRHNNNNNYYIVQSSSMLLQQQENLLPPPTNNNNITTRVQQQQQDQISQNIRTTNGQQDQEDHPEQEQLYEDRSESKLTILSPKILTSLKYNDDNDYDRHHDQGSRSRSVESRITIHDRHEHTSLPPIDSNNNNNSTSSSSSINNNNGNDDNGSSNTSNNRNNSSHRRKDQNDRLSMIMMMKMIENDNLRSEMNTGADASAAGADVEVTAADTNVGETAALESSARRISDSINLERQKIITINERLLQQREKRARTEAHRQRLMRLKQLSPNNYGRTILKQQQQQEQQQRQSAINPASIEIIDGSSTLLTTSPITRTTIIGGPLSGKQLSPLPLPPPPPPSLQRSSSTLQIIDNDLNKLMIGRNRRDSRLYSLQSAAYGSGSGAGRQQRKRPRRYCSARDPTQLAFEAPTVFEGKIISMSYDRRANFSVTFEVKEIFKKQPGYVLPHLLRLQFSYRNSSGECDIYREHMRPRGLVRDELEQGRVYILFVQQINSGNFTILGQPIKKTRRAVEAVKTGVSENYAQPASIKSLTASKTLVQNGEELRIVCRVRGQPPPKVTWFKDDKSINRNRRLYQFIHLKKRSELIVKSFNISDAGLYECRAKNKVFRKPEKRTIRIEAYTRPSDESYSHSTGDECTGNFEQYCLNGGTCQYFREISVPSCECPDGYVGDRCQEKEWNNVTPSPTFKTGFMADDPSLPDSDEDDEDDGSESEEIIPPTKDTVINNKLIN